MAGAMLISPAASFLTGTTLVVGTSAAITNAAFAVGGIVLTGSGLAVDLIDAKTVEAAIKNMTVFGYSYLILFCLFQLKEGAKV